MIPTKPYHVVALHRIDGMVLLGEFDSAAERDDLYRRERAVWLDGGMDSDVKDIVRGELGRIPGKQTAEEADVGLARALAQYMGERAEDASPPRRNLGAGSERSKEMTNTFEPAAPLQRQLF